MPLKMLKSDPHARLKPCLRCGYSLRSIADSRNCPECGLAIWISLSGNDELEMSNPAWLRKVALGTLVLAAANAALVAGVALVQFGSVTSGFARGMVLAMPDVGPLLWVLAAYLAMSGAGLLLVGTDEGRYPHRTSGARRAALVAAAVALLFAAWVVERRLRHTGAPPTFLLTVVSFGQACAGWSYLAAIARRIPSRKMVRLLRGLAVACVIAAVAMIVNGSFMFYIALIAPWSRPVIVWTLFLLIYPLLATATLLYLARSLHRASNAAENKWTTESA